MSQEDSPGGFGNCCAPGQRLISLLSYYFIINNIRFMRNIPTLLFLNTSELRNILFVSDIIYYNKPLIITCFIIYFHIFW